jgi:hypothetical protein
MRYGNPSIPDALAKLRAQAVDRIVVLPLYPQYAASSTATSVARVMELVGAGWDTVPLDIAVPLETLTFVERDGGKYVATIDIHYAAAGHKNNYTTAGRHQQHIEITAEQYHARNGITYRFKTGVQLPEGPSKIAIGVFDAASRLAGFATVSV